MHENDNPDRCQDHDDIMAMIPSDTYVPVEKVTDKDICSQCSKDATVFTDELSKREHGITGWCQACQDSFFG